ncbi:hypothetical protein [Lentzea terrae]|uniref:hypothetical protein n=1 Tax=Lentzea terrae TaxID=2200761 RepID=UPI000DD4D3F2|nr:hypothetical protein [Lentzea terrae]
MFSFHSANFAALAPRDPAVLAKAVDPQPQVPTTAFDDLDPALWLGDGVRRWGSNREDAVHDNTLHAGLALTALKEFEDQFTGTEPLEWACGKAVQAYQDAARLNDEEFSAVLRELFCGALHLMDARGIDLAVSPSRGVQRRLGAMLFELEDLCRNAWAKQLADECTDFEDLLVAACDNYVNQVTLHTPASASA